MSIAHFTHNFNFDTSLLLIDVSCDRVLFMMKFFKLRIQNSALLVLVCMFVLVGIGNVRFVLAEDGGGTGGESTPTVGGVTSLITPVPGCRDPQAINYVSIEAGPWIQNTPSLCKYGTTQVGSLGTQSTQNSSCPLISGAYYQRGDRGEGVTQIQVFLNKEMGLSIPETGYFGQMTEDGVRAFQQKYFDVIITPWGGSVSGTTGRWYKLTAGTAQVLSGCKPEPVVLEGLNKIWDFGAVTQK
jgi:hypothetical protein